MWVESVVGGKASDRVRSEEFDAREGISREELIARVRSAVADTDAVLEALAVDQLCATRSVRDEETTVLDAIFHSVEHFAMHSGQIFWIAKLRAGKDLHLSE